MKQFTLNIKNKTKTFDIGCNKESVVDKMGLPDGDFGNGCYNVWPNILSYDNIEFHFKNDRLIEIKQL